jgi:hypothetical protein
METQGPFTPCSSVIKDGKILPATGDQIYKCCESRCSVYLNDCYDYCENIYPKGSESHSRNPNSIGGFENGLSLNKYPDFIENLSECNQSCKIMNNVCNKICETSRFDYDNRYFDACLEENKCVINDTLSAECLEKKKGDILSCCMKTCKTNAPKEVHSKTHPGADTISDVNEYCKEHCDTSFNIHFQRSLNRPEITNINQVKNINDRYIYIFGWILIIMLFVFYGLKIYRYYR